MTAIITIGASVAIALIGLLIKMSAVESSLSATIEALRQDMKRNEEAHAEMFGRIRDLERKS